MKRFKYRIWLSHPESDCYGWLNEQLYDTAEEAEAARLKLYEESNDGCADYEVRIVTPEGEAF